ALVDEALDGRDLPPEQVHPPSLDVEPGTAVHDLAPLPDVRHDTGPARGGDEGAHLGDTEAGTGVDAQVPIAAASVAAGGAGAAEGDTRDARQLRQPPDHPRDQLVVLLELRAHRGHDRSLATCDAGGQADPRDLRSADGLRAARRSGEAGSGGPGSGP